MKLPNESPDAAEFGLLRAHLAGKGVSQAELDAVIGSNVGGRTRAEISNSISAWLKTRPKA